MQMETDGGHERRAIRRAISGDVAGLTVEHAHGRGEPRALLCSNGTDLVEHAHGRGEPQPCGRDATLRPGTRPAQFLNLLASGSLLCAA
jgi:hypothetical protein